MPHNLARKFIPTSICLWMLLKRESMLKCASALSLTLLLSYSIEIPPDSIYSYPSLQRGTQCHSKSISSSWWRPHSHSKSHCVLPSCGSTAGFWSLNRCPISSQLSNSVWLVARSAVPPGPSVFGQGELGEPFLLSAAEGLPRWIGGARRPVLNGSPWHSLMVKKAVSGVWIESDGRHAGMTHGLVWQFL